MQHQIDIFEYSSYNKKTTTNNSEHFNYNKKTTTNNSEFSELPSACKELAFQKTKNFVSKSETFETYYNSIMRYLNKETTGKEFERSIFKADTELDKIFENKKSRLVGFDYPTYHPYYKLGLLFVEKCYEELKRQLFNLAESLAKFTMFS